MGNVGKRIPKSEIERSYRGERGIVIHKLKNGNVVAETKSAYRNPPGVFSVIPQMQAQLGMSIKDVLSTIVEPDLPVAVREFGIHALRSMWKIFRVDKGEQREVCWLLVDDGRVVAVNYNIGLTSDDEYFRKVPLSAMGKFRCGNFDFSDMEKNVKAVKKGLKALVGEETEEEVVIKGNIVNVFVGGYCYGFTADEDNKIRLITLTYENYVR